MQTARKLTAIWKSRRRLFRWLGAMLSLAVIGLLAFLLWSDRGTLLGLDWGRYGRLAPILLALYLGSLVAQGLGWLILVSSWHRVSWKDLEIYYRSVMMKSLPGTAWHWIGRSALYAGETDMPAGAVVQSTVLEVVFLILTALALIPQGLLGLGKPLAMLGSGLAFAAIFLAGWRGLPAAGGKGQAWRLLALAALYSLAWICGGLIVKGLAQAAGAHDLGWLAATSIWCVTGIAGLLVSFLPSSLGLRELLLVALLAPALPTARIVVIGGLMRLLFLSGDLLWGTAGWAFSWRRGRPQTGSTPG